MGTKIGNRNDDDTVIMIVEDILKKVRDAEKVFGKLDAKLDTEECRNEAEGTVPVFPADPGDAA